MRLTDLSKELNDLSSAIIRGALTVHSTLGPGLLESAYEVCLAHELRFLGHKVERQLPLPVTHRGIRLDAGFRLDLLVNDSVVVEVKAVAKVVPIHDAQLLSYLRLGGYQLGLIINFNVERLKDGIIRLVNSPAPMRAASD